MQSWRLAGHPKKEKSLETMRRSRKKSQRKKGEAPSEELAEEEPQEEKEKDPEEQDELLMGTRSGDPVPNIKPPWRNWLKVSNSSPQGSE